MPRTTVVNMFKEKFDVYIGRPKKYQGWQWGNPWKVGRDGTREECIEKFRRWLVHNDVPLNDDAWPERRQWMLANLHTLRGKRLGCFCPPKACHGDVLAELADLDGFEL